MIRALIARNATLALAVASAAQAATVCDDPAWSSAQVIDVPAGSSIQTAIVSAPAAPTPVVLRVAPGTYAEQLLIANKRMKLVDAGGLVTLRPTSMSSPRIVEVVESTVCFDGLVVDG